MNSRLFGIYCLCALAHIGLAQPDPSVPPPPAPYVATPRPGSSWEIFIEQRKTCQGEPAPALSGNRRPTLIRAEKNGNITSVTVTWSDGTTQSGYVQRDTYLTKSSQTGRLIILSAQDSDLQQPIFVSGYQATGWIRKNDYQGGEKLGSDACYKYHRDYWARTVNGEMTISPEMNAWIRVQDGLPLCVQVGELFFRYRSVKEAAPLSEIPIEIRQKLDQIQAEQNALETMRSLNSNSK